MNAAHLHLMLNHVPLLGTAFGLGLLAWGQWKKSDELKRLSLGLLVFVTLLAVPAYLTGEPAEELVEKLPGVAHDLVEQHEETAQVAFIAQLVLGIGAMVGLLLFRRGRTIPNWFAGAMLVVALVVSGLMARTANLGGKARHVEIRSGARPAQTD